LPAVLVASLRLMFGGTLDLRKLVLWIGFVFLLIILGVVGWFFTFMYEGEAPSASLQPLPEYISKAQNFTVRAADKKRGLRAIRVSITQGGKETLLLDDKFSYEGLLNRDGAHQYLKEFSLDPVALKLAQGELNITLEVRDYARRGEGNLTSVRHKSIVDTVPPSLRAVSRMHNVNVGGVGFAVYQTSPDAAVSGVLVDDLFFPGYLDKDQGEKGIHHCYFAIPYDKTSNPKINLWAKDKAGNEAQTSFYSLVIRKKFREDKIELSDKFIEKLLPYFSFYPLDSEDSDIKKFLKINNDLRSENHRTLHQLKDKTSPNRLWEGVWLSHSNGQTMARFGDHRLYLYKGQRVDDKVHLGVDLASLANAPVLASNNGKVIFADRLGIYGLAVVIDHGQGLASVYGHLSKIEVSLDQEVKKGQPVGLTGDTGLAGGDHLHFAVMLQGIFVNPVEWWDPHWITDNVTKKLALVE
jgi:murein DD-endopeptidase MepM/ murein hydrolase activator NlpD